MNDVAQIDDIVEVLPVGYFDDDDPVIDPVVVAVVFVAVVVVL